MRIFKIGIDAVTQAFFFTSSKCKNGCDFCLDVPIKNYMS